jgi:predicted HicB family RNase H-like nuclease
VAAQPTKSRRSATPQARKFVMASVRLDVATHARVAAAAALSGCDRSTWIGRAINEALAGIVVFDRRAAKPSDQGDLSS